MKILFIFGTRPEAIKLVPLIKEFQNVKNKFQVKVCITSQHKQMLQQVLDFFAVQVDYDLHIMEPNQTLFQITSKIIQRIEPVLDEFKPDLIFVQGDASSAFLGALAGFYKKTKVAHIEAGLRSYEKYAPFPEEINRILISHIADYHFAPTEVAKKNLEKEGIKKNVWVVGNTVIDALFLTLKIISKDDDCYKNFFSFLDFNKKIILVTGHRRESFGEPFRQICLALKKIAEEFKEEVEIVYPVHLNPNVRKPVFEILKNLKNVYLIEPLTYPYFVWLLSKCYFVLTDSGGIQEEAPSLGKPVLVMRDVTERIEGMKAGVGKLVGTKKDKIFENTKELIMNNIVYQRMTKAKNPYGDGKSSKKIFDIILRI
ncbi:MAG: UDP-N-acetylglucosamine 2-epimerase (non-hydrolyzing) [Endomicrobia bacterium]|nr:UDP-N-acetylglucosamine 2-epimerase (non-hydrolyzing) [Endomicrobiia bacterium]